jgi:type II secretory pathway component GspD/PulD (secretin)
MVRCTVLVAVCVLCVVAAWSQPSPVSIQLRWTDATLMAAMLNDEGPPAAEDVHAYRQRWVDTFAQRLVQTLPRDPQRVDPHWVYASTAEAVPREQYRQEGFGGGFGGLTASTTTNPVASMRPAGIQSIVAVPANNSLVVTGDPAAVDRLRELITLLDQKPKMVNITCTLMDAPATRTNEWGMDFARNVGGLLIGSVGNAPGSGLQVQTSRGSDFARAGINQAGSAGQVVTAANVTTTNNIPAIITSGRMIPYTNAEVSYDPFGNRTVTYSIDSVFIGTELFVQPRINGDDSVTMLIRPTFIDAAGSITTPTGINLPITETVSTQALVTVRDGETIQLGGFERTQQDYNTRFGGLLQGRVNETFSHPRLFVTPRIIRDLEETAR